MITIIALILLYKVWIKQLDKNYIIDFIMPCIAIFILGGVIDIELLYILISEVKK